MKIDWKWVVGLVLTLLTLGAGMVRSAAILSYRVEEHEKTVAALRADLKEATMEIHTLDRSVQELNVTLKLKGVMK